MEADIFGLGRRAQMRKSIAGFLRQYPIVTPFNVIGLSPDD
jgi:hypothetical protein